MAKYQTFIDLSESLFRHHCKFHLTKSSAETLRTLCSTSVKTCDQVGIPAFSFMSNKAISRRTGSSLSTVNRGLRQLELAGFITRVGSGNGKRFPSKRDGQIFPKGAHILLQPLLDREDEIRQKVREIGDEEFKLEQRRFRVNSLRTRLKKYCLGQGECIDKELAHRLSKIESTRTDRANRKKLKEIEAQIHELDIQLRLSNRPTMDSELNTIGRQNEYHKELHGTILETNCSELQRSLEAFPCIEFEVLVEVGSLILGSKSFDTTKCIRENIFENSELCGISAAEISNVAGVFANEQHMFLALLIAMIRQPVRPTEFLRWLGRQVDVAGISIERETTRLLYRKRAESRALKSNQKNQLEGC